MKLHSAITKLHEQNLHRKGYNFELLTATVPSLKSYLKANKRGQLTIDFSDATSVRLLNKALILSHYELDYWELPEQYLCPAVPGRAEYIHHIANHYRLQNQDICVLDIGTGASLIYPIIGTYHYSWRFIASDISAASLNNARSIIEHNERLQNKVILRQQSNGSYIFRNVMQRDDRVDLMICNPPFYASREDAQKSHQRKNRNLKIRKGTPPNFSGLSHELWVKGGERQFLTNIIRESKAYVQQIKRYSSLVSRETYLHGAIKALQQQKVKHYEVIEFGTSNKKSRILTWNY